MFKEYAILFLKFMPQKTTNIFSEKDIDNKEGVCYNVACCCKPARVSGRKPLKAGGVYGVH
jgi:hypothetical protein